MNEGAVFKDVLDSVVSAYGKYVDDGCCLERRARTRQTDVGGLKIGGGAEILIQSMTGVKTSDVDVTVKQIQELYDAGSSLVRIAVRDYDDAVALSAVKEKLVSTGYGNVRLSLCMHYNGHLLLERYPECVDIADKFRINPGNVGFLDKWDDNFARIIKAIRRVPGKAIRIGVNWGSLDQSMQTRIMALLKGMPVEAIETVALVVSTVISAKFAEKLDFNPNQIVVSCKVSDPALGIVVNRCIAGVSDYPIHLGVTEAGEGDTAIISTACGLSPLLYLGIGDTIRASLTDHPGSPRSREVEVCKLILQSLGIKNYVPVVNSCPGCGRAKGDVFKYMAVQIKEFVNANILFWGKKYEGVEKMRISVMGCVVNGPGESKKANVGISLPGFGEGEEDAVVVYVDAQQYKIIKGTQEEILTQCKDIIFEYVQSRYAVKVA